MWPRCSANLKAEIENIDKQYDLCAEAWAKGETDGFFTEEFLDMQTYGKQIICLIELN